MKKCCPFWLQGLVREPNLGLSLLKLKEGLGSWGVRAEGLSVLGLRVSAGFRILGLG